MSDTATATCPHDVSIADDCYDCAAEQAEPGYHPHGTSATHCLHGTPLADKCDKCAVHFHPVAKGAKTRLCGCALVRSAP